MLRVRIISNIAVERDYFSLKLRNQYVEEYQVEVKNNPKLNFLDWLRNQKYMTSEQIEALRKFYLAEKLQCKSCDHKFQVKDTDYQQPLVCPNCGSEALETVVKRETKFVKEESKFLSTEVFDIAETSALMIGGNYEPDDLMPNDIINKNLQIIAKVGQGGMGSVYKAKHLNLNVFRAVKVLSSKLMRDNEQELRFIREARSAAVLDHQNIVKVHNVDNEDGRLFIEMEWVEGDSIQDKIKKQGRLTVEESVDFMLQAAKGLSSAHRKGIIHRDIKPDNLMVTEENVVKIADFGLAKPSDSTKDMKISQSGSILGTPYYMSPEQAQNQELTFATDIYSLGVTFYHMLTGEVPYVGQSAIQVLFQHVKSPFPSIRKKLPNMPVEIDQLLLHMTAKNPEMRPESLLEIIEELEDIREKFDLVPVRFTDFRAYSEKKKKRKTMIVHERKRKLPMIIFLIFALLFLALGGFALWKFENFDQFYDMYIKSYFEDDSEKPMDIIPEEEMPPEFEETQTPNVDDATKMVEPVEPTEDQLKIKRNKIAGRKFRALRDEFSGKNFTAYIKNLEELSAEYSDTQIVLEVADEISLAKKNRENAATSWWRVNRTKFIKHVDEKRFVEAYAVLEGFPEDYASTAQAKEVDEKKDEIRKNALMEKDAEILYQEFLDYTKIELLSETQIERIEQIKDTFAQKYADTRFSQFFTAINDFILLAKTNYDADVKRKIFEANKLKYDALISKVEVLLKDADYQGAINLLEENKSTFSEDSDWRIKVEEERNSINLEVHKLFDNALEDAKKQADAGKYLGAEGVEGILRSVMNWGLTPMREKAAELLQNYYRNYIKFKLDKHIELTKFETGIADCDVLLKDERFKENAKYIEYRKNEFALFAQGFVKIPALKMPAKFTENAEKEKIWELKEFYISKFEVTNKQFQEFVDAKGYETQEFWSDEGWKLLQDGKFRYAGGANAPKSWGSSKCDESELNKPVTGISYYEAVAFCAFKGWQLPTQEQWLISAGWDNEHKEWRKYPWGGVVTKDSANFSTENDRAKIADVGRFTKDKSFFGLFDCAGNVREWIRSGSKTEKATVLGGHFLQTDIVKNAEIGKINSIKKSQRESYTGFRCVAVLEKPN